MSPLVGVLALQGGVTEHLRMLEGLGVRATTVRRPHELARVDALVVPGGESSVLDRLLDVAGLRQPLTDALVGGLPALGTCAGLVLLATRIANPSPGQRSLGVLDVTVRRNAFGRQVDSVETWARWSGSPGGPDRLRAAAIRAPEVTAWGEGVEVVATMSVAGVDRVVGVRQGSVIGLSLHPELTGDSTAHHALLAAIAGQRSWTSSSSAWVTAGSPTALAPPPRIPSSS